MHPQHTTQASHAASVSAASVARARVRHAERAVDAARADLDAAAEALDLAVRRLVLARQALAVLDLERAS